MLWANTDLLTDAGVDPAVAPANIDAWIADLEKVRESGVEYPLALGNDWTQVQLFENVLVADLGAVLYQNLWKSTKNWEGDRLRTAVAHYAQLLEFVDPSTLNREWNEATQSVVDGKAAYVVMADFALIAFQQAGYAYGNQYTAYPTPGTVGVFDFLADSFTLPVGAVHEKAAQQWLLTVSSAEGQKALSIRKGSIPARTDTVAEDYPPYQQTCDRLTAARHRRAVARARRRREPDLDEGDHDRRRQVRRRRPPRGARERPDRGGAQPARLGVRRLRRASSGATTRSSLGSKSSKISQVFVDRTDGIDCSCSSTTRRRSWLSRARTSSSRSTSPPTSAMCTTSGISMSRARRSCHGP